MLGFRIYKELYYLTFVDKIERPESKEVFALFKHDYLFANPSFYVFRLGEKINPEDLSFKSEINNHQTQEEYNQMMDKVILENYEESTYYASNPSIKIINNRFLVFSRGGYYFGLYDLKLDKDTFNDCCPFGRWGSQNIWAEKGTYYKGKIPKDEKSDYGIWIEKNIHNKIRDYIETNE